MGKPYDTRLIMMVSQMPFETPDMNQFCRAYFTRLRRRRASFGRSVSKRRRDLVDAHRAAQRHSRYQANSLWARWRMRFRFEESDSASSFYQAQRESIRDLDLKDGVVVVTIPGDAIGCPKLPRKARSYVWAAGSVSLKGSGLRPRVPFTTTISLQSTICPQVGNRRINGAASGRSIGLHGSALPADVGD